MKRNKNAVLLLGLLVAAMSVGFFTSLPNVSAQGIFDGETLAFYNVYTALPITNVSVFMDWFVSEGGTAVNITHLNAANLDGVTALILNCPDADQDESHAVSMFTQAQAEAVRDWFLAPGAHKFLWSSADSSYTIAGLEIGYRPNNASFMLEVLGSKLRYEPTSVEDPYYNAAGSYRPFLNWTTTDPVVADCVENVTDVLAHSPTCLYGMDGNTPVALETTTLPNVHIIMMTGAGGTFNDPNPVTDPMKAHTNGAEGHWVMVAAELGIGGTTNKLVASGCAPIGGYNPMFFDESKGIRCDGQQFVKNTVIWGLTGPVAPPFDPTLLLIGGGVAVAVVIVIVIIYFFMRRRG